jgi:hypothetical protein
MNEIKFPLQTTYFIAYTDKDIFAYGAVESDQEMTTGQPYLYQTTNREEWVQTLIKDFNTAPNETN